MAVELGASRLLAPYFSSSQIVWTIIIGTIMIAMALGNVYGGRMADKDKNPDRLYGRLLLAAVWIAAIPLLGKLVILLVSGLLFLTAAKGFLVIAAFLSCFIIFVFPLFLLGTVTPSLVKYTTDSLEDNGKVVGTLGAANTIGSIIGTFLPTFVTIPAAGTAATFLIFSGLLLVVALIYYFSKFREKAERKKKNIIKVIIAIVLFVVFMIAGNNSSFAFWEKNLAYEGESVYNYLQVKEDDEKTVFATNVLFSVQSLKMKKPGLSGMYYDYAALGPVLSGLKEESKGDILVLGNGTGTFQANCMKYFPNSRTVGVEIDKGIIDLSYEYFDLPLDSEIYEMDGRSFLNFTDQKYDCILVDAYQDITIPFHMSSVEFFRLVKSHLKENGVMVVNMNMRSDTDGVAGINQYLGDTIAQVFPYIYMTDVNGWTNRELFATTSSSVNETVKGIISGDFGGNGGNADILNVSNKELSAFMKRIAPGLTPYESSGNILTDDKAGVELLGMRAIDAIISEQLSYYRSVFKDEGITGLLNSL
ncbi:MAG: fused MFS/spermidine synthase [Lachnospiraceae bacterium]|nr:fused MFS/spermidine synthase [Lachnospiraceae bacterium]MBQ6258830.1 fused MFS/spermidine synthase [Lachnospiraceae bacterium]